MKAERRNLYRVLHVQPEAPPVVIRAAWRALISALHPDAGGSHEAAVRINAAYETLSDPERRAAYDRTLRRPLGHMAAAPAAAPRGTAAAADDWQSTGRCPFCSAGSQRMVGAEPQCSRCAAPLKLAPGFTQERAELIGRRRAQRIAHRARAALQVAGQGHAFQAELRDLSLSGVRLRSPVGVPPAAMVRLRTASFHAVAQVVACRRDGPVYSVHARLVTMQTLAKAAAREAATLDETA